MPTRTSRAVFIEDGVDGRTPLLRLRLERTRQEAGRRNKAVGSATAAATAA